MHNYISTQVCMYLCNYCIRNKSCCHHFSAMLYLQSADILPNHCSHVEIKEIILIKLQNNVHAFYCWTEENLHNFTCVQKFRAYLHALVAGKLNTEFTTHQPLFTNSAFYNLRCTSVRTFLINIHHLLLLQAAFHA